ncbi:S-adenosyl-L-methionine-dependent methyltransferase [Favolaschia claudopus]|uniref:DNA (cytosine-5-)-methyltransferase n=1 Tax=Favolaschia claudopus TaxID=2862362 RepID=A0AAV9ZEC6_9AGAR
MRGPRSMYKKARDPIWTTKATRYAAKRLRIPSAALDLVLPSPVKSRRRKSQPTRHLEDPLVVILEGCLGHSAYFSTALIDNCKYTKGDLVAVAAGDDANKKRMHEEASFSPILRQSMAASAWFCQVRYFFVDAVHGVKMSHVQWFIHGSRVLGELGHPNELFLIDECDDIPVNSIIQKCSLYKLALGEDSALKYEEGEFFGRSLWVTRRGSRRWHQFSKSTEACSGVGKSFHIGDFAYILPALEANEQHCLLLAQILQVDWECHCLHVRYWERQGIADTSTRTDTVDIARLDGKFFCSSRSSWQWDGVLGTAHPDNFFAIPQRTTRSSQRTETPANACGTCYFRHCAGGLSHGLTQSGFFEVELAVDQDILAANTFRESNPRSTVVCTDLNSFLKFSSDRKRGKITDPLVSSDGAVIPNHTVPRLLNLGVLCGASAPPTAIKSSIPLVMAGLASIYRPKFVVFENVPEFIHHSNDDPLGDGLIQQAMLKAMCRSLIEAGFQVRIGILNAAQHGCAQNRSRFIILGARRGLKLPNLPALSHSSNSPHNYSLFLKGEFVPERHDTQVQLRHHIHSSVLTTLSMTCTQEHPGRCPKGQDREVVKRGNVLSLTQPWHLWDTVRHVTNSVPLSLVCKVYQGAASGDTYKVLVEDAPCNTLLTTADPRSGNRRSLHPTVPDLQIDWQCGTGPLAAAISRTLSTALITSPNVR